MAKVDDKPKLSDLYEALAEADWLDTKVYGEFKSKDGHVEGLLYTCQPTRVKNSFEISVGVQYGVVGGEYCSGTISIDYEGKIDAWPSSWVNDALKIILEKGHIQ